MFNDDDDVLDQELVNRIDSLPINRAHRDEARAHFVHVDREIGESLSSARALIEGTAALCRETFGRRRQGALK